MMFVGRAQGACPALAGRLPVQCGVCRPHRALDLAGRLLALPGRLSGPGEALAGRTGLCLPGFVCRALCRTAPRRLPAAPGRLPAAPGRLPAAPGRLPCRDAENPPAAAAGPAAGGPRRAPASVGGRAGARRIKPAGGESLAAGRSRCPIISCCG